MKTAYVANCDLPNHFAHAVQIMKNAQAWHRCSEDFQFISNLSVTSWFKANHDEINQFYGISDPFAMKFYPFLDTTGKHWSPFRETYYRKAAEYLKNWGAELVYTRTFVLPKYTLNLKIPTLVETHGSPSNSREKDELYERLSEDNFLGIVTISDTLRDMYIDYGLPADKILVAPDGADLSMFSQAKSKEQAREVLNYPTDGKYVLYVGHLYGDRGIQDILDAAESFPNVSFLFVGGHPGDVKSWREKLKLSGLKNAEFVGFVQNKEVSNYLWMADVLLMPYSRSCPTAKWMSPLKMFEYMASGRAIIASDLDAIKNVLNHGKDAWLVEADDPQSLRAGIDHLLNDPKLRGRLALESHRRVQEYSWEARVKSILSFAQKGMNDSENSTQ
ncbi:MAG: glycosyltransferase [Gammaproteobacteria bacterium]|nr:glycosyltransferase [Gammaproteobacteria bacterium]